MRRHLVFVLAGVLASMGASYPTANFMVEAPSPQVAQQIGQAAEYYRKQKALDWLGYEMPPWPERCPLRVKVTFAGPGGATSFAFDRGQVLGQHMHIEGPLDRLLASVLPHEVTHTVFAYYFRHPVARWADEGGAVLSEDDIERSRHDMLVRQILNTPNRKIPLRRLFSLRDYPGDVMALYAEGFSVSNFLVNQSNRQTFLLFLGQGMSSNGWDHAVKSYYRYNNVDELEEAWLAHLRATKRPPVQLAQNSVPSAEQQGADAPRSPVGLVLRQTVPPVQPFQTASGPVFRGQSPEPNQEGAPASLAVRTRPGYLPDFGPAAPSAAHDGWQPPPGTPAPSRPPVVQLGPPQAIPQPPPAPIPQLPAPASPIGYPR
jgi:hypothetical protein